MSPARTTVGHDQLYRRVYPAIAEDIGGAMPKVAEVVGKSPGVAGSRQSTKGGRANCVEQRSVRRREGAQVHIIRRLPVPVCSSQRTNDG